MRRDGGGMRTDGALSAVAPTLLAATLLAATLLAACAPRPALRRSP